MHGDGDNFLQERGGQRRVANLAFLKPDFEILAFLNAFGFFWKSKRSQTKSGFF